MTSTNSYVDIYKTSYTAGTPSLTNLVFRFNPSPVVTLHYEKTGVSNIDIPSQVRPIGFDMTSQQRTITIQFVLTYMAAYDATKQSNGYGGTVLDQVEDLDKICQGVNEFSTDKFILVIPFTNNTVMGPLTSGHKTIVARANRDTVADTSGDKLYYVNCKSLDFNWAEGTVSFLKGTMVFEEIEPSGGGVIQI